jgi:methanogenesis marker radical SAM protein
MEVIVDLGGRPGLDCGGFCSFCYFNGVAKVEPSGCRHCKTSKRGCDYCSRAVLEIEPGFKPLDQALFEVKQKSQGSTPEKITIKGNGDISCYPDLLELVKIVSGGEVPVFLEYTSGKGFSSGKEAACLVEAGVSKVAFSLFSTNPELRRRYMNDRHPEAALSNLRTFCENCDVYAMAVLIPGINDGPELEKTCSDLEEMGAKGIVIMIFANTREQGLIFGNAPIMPGIIPHTTDEIRRMATEASKEYKMRVTGSPLWDPHTGAPFALAHHKDELNKLPNIEKEATLITSSLAHPLLSTIFQELGDEVNVVMAKKEIGSLITLQDFKNLDLKKMKDRVIIPGKVLAHDMDILKALRRDGKDRLVFRGPDDLTVESERSICLTPRQVLDHEIVAFTALIEQINYFGTEKRVTARGAPNYSTLHQSALRANILMQNHKFAEVK